LGAGELEEDVFEVGALGAHLVDDDPGGGRGLADRLGGGTTGEQLVGPVQLGLDALGGQQGLEGLGLGSAHPDQLVGAGGQGGQGGLGDQPPPGDDHHLVDGLGDLGQDVAGDQYGAALVGQLAQQPA
jgi:hypothetical protein